MSDFYSLTVTDIAHDTRDAVVVTLTPRADDAERFAFTPGQYLTFRKDFDGKELRRSYSICAGPGEGVLKVGIKRVGGGAFSTFAKSELHVGDTLEAMPPQGRFGIPAGTKAHHYLGFAAGLGITPILSIIKSVLEGDVKAEFTLVYVNRSVAQVMFRRELADLKDRFLDRLNVIHVFSGEAQEIELFSGRIDKDKCKALFGSWVQPENADLAFICGP
ncbi:FAD-binding oxidoreductase [Breoghania sp.]|uniref:FAD-binding oxidoreductase n=1 Tax=Breoghania sp. TaxID=2065378 RepID=UPI0026261CFE|nr:FAD-binding oxidoreductase [Breoghania sp.]MDJ0929857.1 FAD-binding oxidoreductase [Breoghania sp.]